MTLNSAHSLPSAAMRPSRKPRIILAFLIALCGLFVYSYTVRLAEKSSIDERIVATEARIAAAKHEQLELLAEQEKLNQPDFIDLKARTVFDHAKPGDKVLVIVEDANAESAAADMPVAATSSNQSDHRNFPVWQQWVVFFTTDSFKLSLQ